MARQFLISMARHSLIMRHATGANPALVEHSVKQRSHRIKVFQARIGVCTREHQSYDLSSIHRTAVPQDISLRSTSLREPRTIAAVTSYEAVTHLLRGLRTECYAFSWRDGKKNAREQTAASLRRELVSSQGHSLTSMGCPPLSYLRRHPTYLPAGPRPDDSPENVYKEAKKWKMGELQAAERDQSTAVVSVVV